MIELWLAIVFIFVAILCSSLFTYLLCKKKVDDYRDNAEKYYELYTESNQIVHDFIVMNEEIDMDEGYISGFGQEIR